MSEDIFQAIEILSCFIKFWKQAELAQVRYKFLLRRLCRKIVNTLHISRVNQKKEFACPVRTNTCCEQVKTNKLKSIEVINSDLNSNGRIKQENETNQARNFYY